MSTVERYTSAYVEAAASRWVDSSFVPASYRDKATGKAKEADVILACHYLAALSLDPRTWFAATYVVGARVGLMAEAQRVLAVRGGYDLEPVDYDANHATVRGRRRPDGPWREETVTMAMAQRAKWTERNPSYSTMPERMLLARACTFWISHHAPEVKYGLLMGEPGGVGEAVIDLEADEAGPAELAEGEADG